MISSKFLVVCGAAAIAATLGLGMAGAKAAENPRATIAANDNAEIAPVEAETPAGADEQTAQPDWRSSSRRRRPAAKPDSMPRFLRFRATRSPVSRTA